MRYRSGTGLGIAGMISDRTLSFRYILLLDTLLRATSHPILKVFLVWREVFWVSSRGVEGLPLRLPMECCPERVQ